jgi:hypothetical protein
MMRINEIQSENKIIYRNGGVISKSCKNGKEVKKDGNCLDH